MSTVKALVSLASLGLLLLGAAFVFAGAEVAGALGWTAGEPVASLLGGALVGLGAANWMARSSPMGGIYGRAVVIGTQAHFVVGAAALLRYVTRVKTPTLFLHGENDNDVPIAEAEQFFIALKDVGVDTVLVRYPREGHGIREVKHVEDTITRSIAWYRRHFDGVPSTKN